MAHALLAPSAAARWCTCPGSVGDSMDLPDRSSVYAEEGTRMHALAAEAIEAGSELTCNPGDENDQLNTYIGFVLAEARGGQLFVEQSLSIAPITGEPGARGTADAVVIRDDLLHVMDLKWGAGVPVEAEENLQLLTYGCAAYHAFIKGTEREGRITRLRLTIVQPRVGSGRPRSWEISIDEMLKREDSLKECAERALSMAMGFVDPVYHPSEKACRFCKAKGSCKHFAKAALEAAGIEPVFDSMDAPMTAEERGRLLDAVPVVDAWLKSFQEESLKAALDGKLAKGYKLVKGRPGIRKWSDEAEAEAKLKSMKVTIDRRYKMKVISPTDAEKLMKAQVISERQWAKLEQLVTRAEGSLLLVPESDKRPAENPPDLADMFPEIK